MGWRGGINKASKAQHLVSRKNFNTIYGVLQKCHTPPGGGSMALAALAVSGLASLGLGYL